MGGNHRVPKKDLKFGSLLRTFRDAVAQIPDIRKQERITYTVPDIYLSAFALFYLQDPSLLEFQRRCQEQAQQNNLSTVFGVDAIPSDTQLRDVIDGNENGPIRDIFRQYFHCLQRGKQLESFRFLGGSYLIVIDGSEYFTSESIHCKKCLTSTSKKDGIKRYHHQILQGTVVHPDKREVIPLAPEFIRNEDGTEKQDCERNAGKRLMRTIKKDHPHLPIIIAGDSLYANTPFLRELKECGFSYLLVAKPNDHKSLYKDITGLRNGGLLDSLTQKGKNGREYVYEWVNTVDLTAGADSLQVNYCSLTIRRKGKVTYTNGWITDIEITRENIEEVVRGGRARWKIGNEGFNTLKNHGYHLEHNFGHGENNLSETFFLLNLLAFFFHQIFQICDGLYQQARNRFSARREFWNCIRSTFRLFIFRSWEELLERINGPPLPISVS
jgi:hypothetical protein